VRHPSLALDLHVFSVGRTTLELLLDVIPRKVVDRGSTLVVQLPALASGAFITGLPILPALVARGVIHRLVLAASSVAPFLRHVPTGFSSHVLVVLIIIRECLICSLIELRSFNELIFSTLIGDSTVRNIFGSDRLYKAVDAVIHVVDPEAGQVAYVQHGLDHLQ